MKFNQDTLRRWPAGSLFHLAVLGTLAAGLLAPGVARAGDEAVVPPRPVSPSAAPNETALPTAPAQDRAHALPLSRASAPEAERSKPRVYTNADLEALGSVPVQKKPIAESPGWDFVLTMIDRERAEENRRKDREAAREALAAREAELSAVSFPDYLPGVIVGSRFCRGRCGTRLDIPSNTFESLDMRGIRTAADLFHESVANAQIQRRRIP